MIDNPQNTVRETEEVRKELILLWQEYLVNSTDIYNKQGTKRARLNLVKLGKIAKKYRELTTEFSKIPANDLIKMKELEQQKTTL